MQTTSKSDRHQNIMLFDLDIRGHHASYIQHLIVYWQRQKLPGQLDIVVVPEFVRQYSYVVATAEAKSNINLIAISSEEASELKTVYSTVERFRRSFQEWQLVKKYTKIRGSTHCMLMFFDSLLWRMSFGVKPPCAVSGIFFRPISHYRNFSNYQPSSSEKIWELREQFGLSRILKAGYLENLFSLDPLAVDYLAEWNCATNLVYLPDPVQTYDTAEVSCKQLKQDFGIQPNRQVFLLFGALTERKGIYQLLEAVEMLPVELAEKFCLLLVGVVEENKQAELKATVARLTQLLPVQIIECYEYVSDRQMQLYFTAADVILAPYQRHVGMSGILVQAAAATKPVLASDYGLMGEVTRRHSLGITVNSEVPQKIAEGLTRFLMHPDCGDLQKMREFAAANTAQKFASKIFSYLLKNE